MLYHYYQRLQLWARRLTNDRNPSIHSTLDGFAIGASSLCMVHCLGLPLLLVFAPLLASRIDPGETFHILMLAAAIPTSLLALTQGWRRHRMPLPSVLGLTGLLLLAGGALIAYTNWLETGCTVTGSLILATAHMLNLRSKDVSTCESRFEHDVNCHPCCPRSRHKPMTDWTRNRPPSSRDG